MADEIKAALDKLGNGFEEFKATNDRRLAEIEKRGAADAVTEEKIRKINAELDKLEDLNRRLTAAAAEQKSMADAVNRIETRINRPGTGGFAGGDRIAEERKAAFGGFLRRGADQMPAEERKALTVSNDTTGGFLAPSEFVREIIKGVVEYSPMRGVVRVRTTGQRSAYHPKRTGTFAARWVGETETRTETTGLAYGLAEIPTHEMTAEVYVSMQDVEDSAFDLEAELSAEFTEQFGVAEGTAIVTGNGIGKPVGFMTDADVAFTVSGAATAVAADGIIALFHAIKTAYARNATWVLNRTTLGTIRTLKADGQYIWQLNLREGIPNTILGAPYVEAPDMPSEAAGTFPIAFGDFRRAYVLADRIALSVLRDPYSKASEGQVKFVARKRLGGQVVLAEAIRKLKCST